MGSLFTQHIKLLAAGIDGGNVSQDGCHTPLVKEFLSGGHVMRNLPGPRAELGHRRQVETNEFGRLIL